MTQTKMARFQTKMIERLLILVKFILKMKQIKTSLTKTNTQNNNLEDLKLILIKVDKRSSIKLIL
jgi:hypothetical protein